MVERDNSPGWATYLRVSDEDKQSPERSFAMQRQRIQEQLLKSSRVSFKREYKDLLSGTTKNRADYQQMLSDAQAGLFSHLGLYRADRFGRNTVEGLQAATQLMALGIKLRVASMPSLHPEEPDGFFMFLIQMGMAQREVEIMRQRTRDGTEAKMRAGGWPNNAPVGYVNQERHLKSGKYERWIEKDPENNHVIRDAWDLLLTDRYTLDQICEELNKCGYTRRSGKPWAWNTPKRGNRQTAKSTLQHIFHNPIYAGWVVSERFGIPFGEIKGKWDPTITTVEYERGIEILKKHDSEKSRKRRHFYLLRNLLYIKESGKNHKIYGSTPSGRSQSYAYYITHAKPNGKKLHIPCEKVEAELPRWLAGISVSPELVPAIREIYQGQVNKISQEDREFKLDKLNSQLKQLRTEEAHLGRLLITGKISEETYDQLREEWQEKVRNIQNNLITMERETTLHLDDLDTAIFLMTKMVVLYERLEKKRSTDTLADYCKSNYD